MKKVKIRESLGIGWSLFMKRPLYLIGLTLAVVGLFVATASSSALATALSSIVYAGYIVLLIKHSRGETIDFDDLFTIDQRWVYFAFLTLIKGFFILLGLLCFIVPGVYLSVRWMFAEMLVVDKGMKPLQALRESSALTAGYRWKLFLFACVGTFLVVVGVLFLIVGAVIAAIVTFFAMVQIYQNLQIREESSEVPQA
jgi:uncharacterized membrane protein